MKHRVFDVVAVSDVLRIRCIRMIAKIVEAYVFVTGRKLSQVPKDFSVIMFIISVMCCEYLLPVALYSLAFIITQKTNKDEN